MAETGQKRPWAWRPVQMAMHTLGTPTLGHNSAAGEVAWDKF
jgi:hypothetical protein